jgi:hypothetical protein
MAGTFIGGARPNVPARWGPFQDGSGNLWVITLVSSSPTAFESTNGGATWVNKGSFSASTGGTYLDCAFDSANGIIYCLCQNSLTQIAKFTISTTTWAAVTTGGQGVSVQADVSGIFPAFLVRLSTGAFVVVYQGPTASSMGTNYRQMYYVSCTSAGVWGTATLAYGVSGNHIDTKCAVLGASDRTHMLCATATPGMEHVSLSSAGALDTPESLSGVLGAGAEANFYTLYYDATLAKLVASGGTGTDTPARATSGASPVFTADSNAAGSDSPSNAPAVFYYDTTGSKLYVFYYDSTTTNLFVNSAPSTTWGTAAQQDAPGTLSFFSVGKVTNGIGVMFYDLAGPSGNGFYYDTHSFLPPGKLLPSQVRLRVPKSSVPARMSHARF